MGYGKNGLFHMNIRSPGYVNCINWCAELWDKFSSKIIRFFNNNI